MRVFSTSPLTHSLITSILLVTLCIDYYFIAKTGAVRFTTEYNYSFGMLLAIILILLVPLSRLLSTSGIIKKWFRINFGNIRIIFVLISTITLSILVTRALYQSGPSELVNFWHLFLPSHIFLSLFFLLYDGEYEPEPWNAILHEIRSNMQNEPGQIIRLRPVLTEDGFEYEASTEYKTEERVLSNRLEARFMPYLIGNQSTTGRTTYSVINRRRLLSLKDQKLPLSIVNLAKLEQSCRTHLLLLHLFGHKVRDNFDLPKGVKAMTRNRHKFRGLDENNLEITYSSIHHWNHSLITHTADFLLDSLMGRRSERAEDKVIDSIFMHLANSTQTTDKNNLLVLSYLILLSGNYEPGHSESKWTVFNMAFSSMAKGILEHNDSSRIQFQNPRYNQELIDRIFDTISEIRISPVEKFIEYHDNLVRYLKQNPSQTLQVIIEDSIERMLTNLREQKISRKDIIDRKQLRKEIISGTTVGLFCLFEMIGGD